MHGTVLTGTVYGRSTWVAGGHCRAAWGQWLAVSEKNPPQKLLCKHYDHAGRTTRAPLPPPSRRPWERSSESTGTYPCITTLTRAYFRQNPNALSHHGGSAYSTCFCGLCMLHACCVGWSFIAYRCISAGKQLPKCRGDGACTWHCALSLGIITA